MAFESGNIPKETLDYLAAKKAESDRNATGALKVVLVLLVILGIAFTGIAMNSDNTSATAKQSSAKVDAPTLPYQPHEIIAQAKAYMVAKEYRLALDELDGLHPPDSASSDVRSMLNKATEEVRLAEIRKKRSERMAYAQDYERALLSAGMDATVRATGHDAETLAITFILVNRPFVYQIETNSDLKETWLSHGFVNVRLSDGFDSSWSYKLK